MALEDQQDQQNQELDTNQEVEQRQYSDDEMKAMDHGWVPKDQWKGPDDEWIPAKVFNMRGEFFSRIARDKQTINELKQSLDALVDHNRKIEEVTYKRALEDLKREKRAALEVGDPEAVMRIDDEIDELRVNATKQKQEFETKLQVAKRSAVPVEFEQWHSENQWYQSDPELTGYADGVGRQLAQQAQASGKSVDWTKFYQEVSRKVRQKFPEKFETRTRKTVAAGDTVDSNEDRAANRPSSSGSIRESELTDDQRRIMNNILKTTKMTKKEYLDQMAKFEQRKNGR